MHSQPTTKNHHRNAFLSTPHRQTTELNFDPLEVHNQPPSRPLRSRTIASFLSFENIQIYEVTYKKLLHEILYLSNILSRMYKTMRLSLLKSRQDNKIISPFKFKRNKFRNYYLVNLCRSRRPLKYCS